VDEASVFSGNPRRQETTVEAAQLLVAAAVRDAQPCAASKAKSELKEAVQPAASVRPAAVRSAY